MKSKSVWNMQPFEPSVIKYNFSTTCELQAKTHSHHSSTIKSIIIQEPKNICGMIPAILIIFSHLCMCIIDHFQSDFFSSLNDTI